LQLQKNSKENLAENVSFTFSRISNYIVNSQMLSPLVKHRGKMSVNPKSMKAKPKILNYFNDE